MASNREALLWQKDSCCEEHGTPCIYMFLNMKKGLPARDNTGVMKQDSTKKT